MVRPFQPAKLQIQLALLKKRASSSRKMKTNPRKLKSRPCSIPQKSKDVGIVPLKNFESFLTVDEDVECNYIPQSYWDELYELAFISIQSSPWEDHDV
jgi:hypothetical protein